MIEELTWDSAFFKRKIGVLLIRSSSEPLRITKALERARKEGFEYVTCKLRSQDTSLIRLLESFGFYLTDIGVTLVMKTGTQIPRHAFLDRSSEDGFREKAVRLATAEDIPMLRKIIKSLFPDSRFYSDPFFSKKDADRLYEIWIENSVRGDAADVVYCIPEVGFVTCRRSAGRTGEIILLGIRKSMTGKGFGSALLLKAVQWFTEQGLKMVTVRTQLKNLGALNFYLASGFLPKSYDIHFGNIL